MSSIAVAKSSMGFTPAKSRPGCWNCIQCTSKSQGPLGDSGQFYGCKAGGFYVSALAICKKHETKTATPGSPQ